MTTVLLVRHGRTPPTPAACSPAGRPACSSTRPGTAQAQARRASGCAAVPLAAVVTSPLERCQETAGAVAAGRDARGADRRPARRVPLRRLDRPAAQGAGQGPAVEGRAGAPVRGGRSPGRRGVAGADARPARSPRSATGTPSSGPDAVWLACSHGDVIKAIVADALGMHLDQFQRIVVDPARSPVIRYTELRPFVVRLNDTGGDVVGAGPAAEAEAPAAPRRRRRRRGASAAAPGAGDRA